MQASPRHKRAGSRCQGFTIVELLVVIAIIAVLAGLLMPALNMALNKAHETATASRIHQCELAAQTFFNNFGDYPPSHWYGLDELLKYDSDDGSGGGPDGIYDRTDDEVFFEPPDPAALNDTTDPSTVNEGIEVLTACIASRNGGPYIDLDQSWLRNIDGPDGADPDDLPDGDYDDADGNVAACTNWYFGSNDIFEIVDWWGNPLVYVHNRDYADCDGYDDTPPGAWDGSGALTYADYEGVRMDVFARSTAGFMTRNYPNLNSFQLYSWGIDEYPGCDETAPGSGIPNPNSVGDLGEPTDGQMPGWTAASGNITNWEE